MKTLFHDFTEQNKSEAIKKLIADSTPDRDFFFLVFLSVLMATFGFLLDNVPVLIGSMLIAPLLSPVLGIALGIVMADGKLISRSSVTVALSFIISVFLSAVIALLFLQFVDGGVLESYKQWDAFFVYFSVAFIAGLAASFSLVAPQMSSALPGAAIAVTLIPPIAAVGLGIANFDWSVISGAFIVFVINTLGIVFASMIMFSLMNLYVKRTVAQRAVTVEDKKNNADKKE